MSLLDRYEAEAAKWNFIVKQTKIVALTEGVRVAADVAKVANVEMAQAQSTSSAGRKEIDELKNKLDSISADVDLLEKRISAEKDTTATNNSNDRQRAIFKLERDLYNLKTTAIEQNILICDKVEEIDAARLHIAEIEAKADSANRRSAELVEELQSLTAECAKLSDEINKKWPGLKQSGSSPLDMDKFTQEIADEKSNSKSLRMQLFDAEAMSNKLKQELTKLKERDQNGLKKDARIEYLDKQLEQAQDIIRRQQAECDNKAQTVHRLSSDLNRASEQLNQDNEAADNDKLNLEAEISDLEIQLKKMIKEISDCQAVIEIKIVEIDDLEHDKTALVEDLQLKDVIISKLTQDLNTTHALVDKLTKDIANTAQEISQDVVTSSEPVTPAGIDFEAQLHFERTINEQLNRDMVTLQLEVKRLNAMLDGQEAKGKIENSEIEDALKALETAKKDIVNLTSAGDSALKEKKELVDKLTEAESTVSRHVAEIETLKANTKSSDKELNDSNVITQTSEAEVAKLTSKIEEMKPLYDVGVMVRTRRLEMLLPKQNQNHALLKAGLDIAFYGAALPDVTLFMDFTDKPFHNPAIFEQRYNVSPSFVWQNRGFAAMIESLSMRFTMASDPSRLRPQRHEYIKDCDRFLHKIIPSGGVISSDEQVQNDSELLGLYNGLKSRYATACDQAEQSRARKFSK